MSYQILKNQLTFIHIPKTAGLSVQEWIKNNFLDIKKLSPQHQPPMYFFQKYNLNLGNKFCIVRNPWDRYVSAWNYELSIFKNKEKYKIKPRKILTEEFINKGFKNYILNNRLLSINQYEYYKDCEIVLKFENLDQDFKIIQNITNCHEPLLKQNQHHHAHYSSYYNDETIEIVYNLCQQEIKDFKYTF